MIFRFFVLRKGRRDRWRLQGAVWAVLAVMSAAAAEAGPEKAVLAFAPASGTVLEYDFSCRIVSQANSADGSFLPFQAVARGVIRMAAGPPRSGGNDIRLSSDGIDVDCLFQNQKEHFRVRIPQSEAVGLAISRTGLVSDVRNGAALEKRSRMNFSILDMIGFCFPALPDSSRTVGESWTGKKRIRLPFQGMTLDVDLALDYFFNSLLNVGNGRLAVLQASPAVTARGASRVNGLAASVRGEGGGTAALRLDPDRNIIEAYSLETNVSGEFRVGRPDAPLFKWPLSLLLAFELNRRTPPSL